MKIDESRLAGVTRLLGRGPRQPALDPLPQRAHRGNRRHPQRQTRQHDPKPPHPPAQLPPRQPQDEPHGAERRRKARALPWTRPSAQRAFARRPGGPWNPSLVGSGEGGRPRPCRVRAGSGPPLQTRTNDRGAGASRPLPGSRGGAPGLPFRRPPPSRHDPAVGDVDDPAAAMGEVGVVGDQHQRGAALLAQREHQVHDRRRRWRGRGCRWVRRPAAAAAPGRRRGRAPPAAARRRKAAPADGSAGGPVPPRAGSPRPGRCAAASPASSSGIADVLQRGHGRDQVERLEHDADRGAAQPGQRVLRQGGDFLARRSRTLPEVARSSPASTISRLVLPEPDGPTTPTASPAAMSRSMPCRMLTAPALDGTVRRRSRTCTIGPAARASGRGAEGRWHPWRQRYGPRRRFLKAIGVAGFAWFSPAPAARPAAPVRLLVLGDSLAAGYGLAQQDGFQAQLAAALQAHGPRRRASSTARSRATPPPAAGRGWTGRWPTGRTRRWWNSAAMTGCAGSTRRRRRRTWRPSSTPWRPSGIPVLLSGMYAPPNLGAGLRAGVPGRVRPTGCPARGASTIRSSWRAWPATRR